MAAPVVSGTVALMLQANPNLTPNLVKAILQYTAQQYRGYSPLAPGRGLPEHAGRGPPREVLQARASAGDAHADAGDLEPAHHLGQPSAVAAAIINPHGNAWSTNIVWGTAHDDNIVWGTDGDNIVWGTDCGGGCDNIVWGTDDASGDNIVWGTDGDDNIVWGTGGDDNIVWGTTATTTSCGAPRGDNIVWGTDGDDNIVWGTDCGGADCDNIVWGTAGERQHRLGHGAATATTSCGARPAATTSCGARRDDDNIVWGTSGGDNIVWGTSADSDATWGSIRRRPGDVPEDERERATPERALEFGDIVSSDLISPAVATILGTAGGL